MEKDYCSICRIPLGEGMCSSCQEIKYIWECKSVEYLGGIVTTYWGIHFNNIEDCYAHLPAVFPTGKYIFRLNEEFFLDVDDHLRPRVVNLQAKGKFEQITKSIKKFNEDKNVIFSINWNHTCYIVNHEEYNKVLNYRST